MPLSGEERERQARVMKVEAADWQKLIDWMKPNPEYSGFPISICGTILGYAGTGWQKVPSPRQTAKLVEYIDAWNEDRNGKDEE